MGATAADMAPHDPEPGPEDEQIPELGQDDIDAGVDDGPFMETASEKRRRQAHVFERWLISEAADKELFSVTTEKNWVDTKDEDLSLNDLMTRHSANIINSPREYQMELFERAKRENIIAVLGTGTGKTLIAVLLLRWVIDQELESRARGATRKISVFLVPSVNLVYQQAAVLESNLDHKIAKFCGAMNSDAWGKGAWDNHFSQSRVVVCTPEILLQCLKHAFVTIKQINLIIFDEAHHAKKNNPYARIIKDYYLEEFDFSARPRIFGMTASPVDSKTDVVEAARQLETILHSRIATITTLSEQYASKPEEITLQYKTLRFNHDTAIAARVRSQFGYVPVLQPALAKAAEIAADLGDWCADTYLFEAFSQDKLTKYEMMIERRFHALGSEPVETLNMRIKDVRAIGAYIKSLGVLPPDRYPDRGTSTKVDCLLRWLYADYERPCDHRCIVFVERRRTARLLDAVFKALTKSATRSNPNLRTGYLTGGNSGDVDEDTYSNRQQILTLARFRDGSINCLFATSVAEEGLDVMSCNRVVRFDVFSTMIQYVQSRGRARRENSKLVHMIEWGNAEHIRRFHEVKEQEADMQMFYTDMPDDRRILSSEDAREAILAHEQDLQTYREPSTGATINYANSLGYLANFVSAIPTNEDGEPRYPTYIISPRGRKFQCEVIVPGNTPVRSRVGLVCAKKSLAKRSAAFEACVALRKTTFMDEHLLPAYVTRLPKMRYNLLSRNLKSRKDFTMRTKPAAWEKGRDSIPGELYITTIDFPEGLDRKHQPLALLTRTRLPELPQFPIFLNDGRESHVKLTCIELPLSVTDAVVNKLSAFTFRVFKDVFSKTYENDGSKLSYWLAPAVSATPTTDDVSKLIDWVGLDTVFDNEEFKWSKDIPDTFLHNRFVVDVWDGSRKFFSSSVNPDLKPLDDVPSDCPKHRWNANILDYSISLFNRSRAKLAEHWLTDQPVLEAEKVLHRRNMLAHPTGKEALTLKRAVLCPQPLRISALCVEVVATCLVFPAIIHRLESYLIALEACEMLGINCSAELALEAVTKDSDNGEDQEAQERVNFQHGMGNNYERLEFMGDCFLKAATTIAVFVQHPRDDQFVFHMRRMMMLCNNQLNQLGKKLKIYEFVRTKAFSRRAWYPEGIRLIEGLGAKKEKSEGDGATRPEGQHFMGPKTLADVCEALIGAAFMAHNRPGAWHPDQWSEAIGAVTKLVGREDHRMSKWADYLAKYQKQEYQLGAVTASQLDLAEKVELEHSYHFKYPKLLRSAFMHPSLGSMLYERIPNYERLEFLGDALLDLACVTHLFYRFPGKDPQWLTEHKMAMVSNKFLGCVCVDIGFHRHVRFASTKLPAAIQLYATELLEAKQTAGGRRDYWTMVGDPPKCLADVVEAFIGAMFIDSDLDWNQVQRFFDEKILPYFQDMSAYDNFANNHPCTHLNKLLQDSYGCRDYRLMVRDMPGMDLTDKRYVVAAVLVHDEVVGCSKGASGRYARLRAAESAVKNISGLRPSDFRAKFGCNCGLVADAAALGAQHTDGIVPTTIEQAMADCAL